MKLLAAVRLYFTYWWVYLLARTATYAELHHALHALVRPHATPLGSEMGRLNAVAAESLDRCRRFERTATAVRREFRPLVPWIRQVAVVDLAATVGDLADLDLALVSLGLLRPGEARRAPTRDQLADRKDPRR